MRASRTLIPVLAILLAVAAYNSLFRVEQWQQAIVFQFREIDRTVPNPGLHFMFPFVNTVQIFEKRLLTLNQGPQRFLTKEKKDVFVDFYVKWRIVNVGDFYRATAGDLARANTLLAQRINSALRDEFGDRTVQEVVAGERGKVMDMLGVSAAAARLSQELGVDVVDVRTMRIDLPEEVSNSVYERMRAERERVAKDFRARGDEQAERIRAAADRDREVLLAQAYQRAEEVRGEGDAESTRIYADAFGRDEEFYNFYRSLNAYRNSFREQSDILLLGPQSDFFKYFKDPGGGGE